MCRAPLGGNFHSSALHYRCPVLYGKIGNFNAGGGSGFWVGLGGEGGSRESLGRSPEQTSFSRAPPPHHFGGEI